MRKQLVADALKNRQFMNEVKEEVERRIKDAQSNWTLKEFGSNHTSPYVFAQVFVEKIKANEN